MNEKNKGIKYRRGYKFKLCSEYSIYLPQSFRNILIRLEWFEKSEGIVNIGPLANLHSDGELVIRAGYSWDGASGGIDTKDFLTPSLVHDVLYQSMRLDVLPVEPCRMYADELLRQMCIDRGMFKIRAAWVYHAVRMFGGGAATEEKEVLFAP